VELRDFIVTPFVIVFVYAVAYMVRGRVTDAVTRPYYFPALSLKIFGAIALGFIYQFYYGGGDTFAYHTHGSRHIWEAFMDSPQEGLKLLFAEGQYGPGYWDYAEKIWYYRDQNSFFVIRVATVLDLITFSTYSATAVLFSVIAFVGGWMMFATFYHSHPDAHRWLAISCLFVPSVIFWGSGILKDTLTLSFIGISTYCVWKLFIRKRFSVWLILLLILSFFIVYSIKKYILISFVAAVMVWIAAGYFFQIRMLMLRIMMVPFVVIFCVGATYYSLSKLLADDPKYSLDKLAKTAMVTAYDIRYWTGKDAGSGYTLGELDGSLGSMIRLAPSAINVSLFRPYLWEVRSPLMVLSAVESFMAMVITLYLIIRIRLRVFRYMTRDVVFCLAFALIFAFGVGVSTYNFGTLARYKIPLLPFYMTALGLIYHYWLKDWRAARTKPTLLNDVP
jgi:hypothetical protein